MHAMEDYHRSLSYDSSQINLSAVKAHFLHKTICVLDFANGVLIVLYVGLLLFCLFLLSENWLSCKSGQNSGLLWYLGCTSILCICRFTGFALVLSKGTDAANGCTIGYRTFQWELDGIGDENSSLYYSLLVLSTSSSALFFTSYSYFAHSLSRVLDLLTAENNSEEDSSVMKYSFLLVALNSAVWVSVFLLWASRMYNSSSVNVFDSIAQYSLATAALVTCVTFGFHLKRVLLFLKRGDQAVSARAEQINSLLKLRRVMGVCIVCTVCFAVRAILLLSRGVLGPVETDIYFFLSEIAPTTFMLIAFKKSPVTNYTEIEMGDSASSFSTSYPFSSPISTTTSSSSSSYHLDTDMFGNIITHTHTRNDFSPVKQNYPSKFYYFNRFLSFFYLFLYDEVSAERVSNDDNTNTNNNNSKHHASSYQNGNYANKVRDSLYRNKPEKPYHPSENHSLLSYQNGGEGEEEEEEGEDEEKGVR